MRPRPEPPTPARTRGYVSIHAALSTFALMGLLGVIVDVGRARLEVRQLEVWSELASTEVLRSRGDANATSEQTRRENVATFVRNASVLLHDTRRATGRTSSRFERTRGDHGLESWSITDDVWHPNLQANPNNLWQGDILAGTYDPWETHESSTALCTDGENSQFCRADFTPVEGTVLGDSVLVTLRRSDTPAAEEAQGGVSSHGPGLRTIFAWAPVLDEWSQHDVDEDLHPGVTLRAHSIAGHRTVVAVGEGGPGLDHGACHIALRTTCWDLISPSESLELRSLDTWLENKDDGAPCGLYLGSSRATAVGQSLGHAGMPTEEGPFEPDCWLPLIGDDSISDPNMVIGFVRARVSWDNPNNVYVRREITGIAEQNASAHWPRGLLPSPNNTLRDLLSLHASRTDLLRSAVIER